MNAIDKNDWLREQIAFAIFNSTNPPHVRDSITDVLLELANREEPA